MKGIWCITLSIFVMACGGSLSDEQRKKLHEGMEDQKIVKLSDSEIITASLEKGRSIYTLIEKLNFEPSKIDSLSKEYQVKIKLITPGSDNALEVENQLIEAYIVGAETGAVQDNIQKLHVTQNDQGYDSLVYTRPKVSPLPEGVVKVEGIWNIYMAKKDVVRSIGKK
jgi:hypothetical protein